MKVYLAGPITGLSYTGAVGWREFLTTIIRSKGHEAISPMRGKDFLRNVTAIEHSYEDSVIACSKAIYGRDEFDIRQSDILFANLTEAETVSIGTVMEIQMARVLGKYILVCMEDNNIHQHPFVREASNLIVPTMDDGIRALTHLLF